LGWRPQDYNYFSPSEFYSANKGHDKLMQQHWAMARFSAFYSGRVAKKIKKPSDLLKLEIDEKPIKKRGEIKLARVTKIDGNN
jgi:hypothetical protein